MLISSLIQQANEKWFNVQKKTTEGVQSAKDAVFRGGLIIICGILIVWISIFLYTAFYYAYMPSMTHVRPVHLQFKSCDKEKGVCSFPSAYVQLTKKQQLLMVGQPYKVNLELEMPESPANKELGMFMVCAQLRSRDGVLVKHACRTAMLHYRSTLLHLLMTLTYSPMMIFGALEEKQSIVLELFGNFEEDQSHPVTIVYVEIQSRHIEFYSATIMINAHLSGLRYLMFHWPILSAIIGIGTNLFFIVLICILSYLHFASEEENANETFNYEKGETEEEKDMILPGDLGSDTSSVEDTSLLDDIPKSQDDSPSLSSTDPVLSKSSYIQEISSLITESTKEELNK
ncbi:seipin [Nasonia vitripennis]|uniref:Seipin n=1 Tax=Nasonia vitripennis TaxID=7425 RepID=A0A7M7GC12_NASVI|nr:seipin [Nasonia vitripennis]